MASPRDIRAAIVAALDPIAAQVDGLQIVAGMNNNPTPPSIDVYPATPFQIDTGQGFDRARRTWVFTIRARANVADQMAAQDVLLDLLDTTGPASVENALLWDGFPYTVDLADGYPTGFQRYDDTPGEVIGCEWHVEVTT